MVEEASGDEGEDWVEEEGLRFERQKIANTGAATMRVVVLSSNVITIDSDR